MYNVQAFPCILRSREDGGKGSRGCQHAAPRYRGRGRHKGAVARCSLYMSPCFHGIWRALTLAFACGALAVAMVLRRDSPAKSEQPFIGPLPPMPLDSIDDADYKWMEMLGQLSIWENC
eukprot:s977_g19.t1